MKTFYSITLILGALWALFGVASADSDGALQLEAALHGAHIVPTPIVTVTTGKAKFDVYTARIEFELDIEDATAILGATGAQLRCAAAGQTGPVVAFLAGEVPGGFNGDVEIKGSLTKANIVNTACGGTVAALAQAMAAGNTYVSVGSVGHAGGEIRGQVHVEVDD